MLNRKRGLSRKKALSRKAFNKGFTLIEVMVAIMVFASLSIAAYQVVNQVQRSNQLSAEKTGRLQEMQRAMIIMDSDFRQMVARSFKGRANANGNRLLYVDQYLLDSQSQGILFTRLGWQNPQQAFPRGEVVKVGYRVVDNQLERVWWRYPDTPEGQEPLHKSLLADVEELSFRFYDSENNSWQETWQVEDKLPQAVEVTLQLKDYAKIRRVYLTAQGQASSLNSSDEEITQ
ncbi:type II secretion system minor pseudopilin GspJ [Vibrio sp. CK2-1]|uniref:type II secretion system minor pseudopilin GspJ n=1 Tax=Vibrio sp. CK2-1 TaxID=2912249 RepID=UPI001F02987C|nr:type II secretion system minor pseudopilin GspJ [Vibrio sp. CK2-1]MCF7355353.1 type II secretion system minor pseudopilin GspJ [Vibrio sp. CK2-1]